jgi:hypothetical protein
MVSWGLLLEGSAKDIHIGINSNATAPSSMVHEESLGFWICWLLTFLAFYMKQKHHY